MKSIVEKCLKAAAPALLAVATLSGPSRAASGPGTTGANFLKIPIGPREVAMGDQGVALTGDAFGMDYNPASMAVLGSQEAAFADNQWIEGVTQEYLTYVNPTLAFGSLGASVNLLQVGAFQGYDASGAPAGTVSAQELAARLGYARVLYAPGPGSGLAAGVSFETINERLETNSSSGYAAGAGLLAYFPYHGVDVAVGTAYRNLGSAPGYYGTTPPLPETFSFGASGTRKFYGNPATLSAELDKAVDNVATVSVGAECWIFSLLALRAGFRSGDSLGSGFRSGVGLKVRSFQIDYGMSIMGNFGLTNQISVTYRFGGPSKKPAPDTQGVKS